MIFKEVKKNKVKTFFIVSFFFLFIALFIYFVCAIFFKDAVLGLILGLSFSIITSFISYYNSDKMILSLNKARPATREEFLQLNVTLESLCIAAGIPKPKLYVMEESAMNAFATGRNPQNAVICVTTGLLNKLDKYEMEGVLAHELSHIKNYDILVSTIAVVMVGFVVMATDFITRIAFYSNHDDDNKGNIVIVLIGLVFIILSPIFANLLKLAISRNREYLADASAIEITRNRDGLINALKKLTDDSEPLTSANKASEGLYIVSPFVKERKKKDSIWSTHPNTENRIKRLMNIN